MTIDIDAVLGESRDRTLIFKGQQWVLPGELPGACIAPFLDPDLGLPQIVADLIVADEEGSGETKDETEDESSWVSALLDTLIKRPDLPLQLVEAGRTALNELFDYVPGRAEELHALKPSVPAYAAIAVGIAKDYGMDLTSFFFSDESSGSDGDGSKPTSPASTPDSTPEGSGDAQEPTAS